MTRTRENLQLGTDIVDCGLPDSGPRDEATNSMFTGCRHGNNKQNRGKRDPGPALTYDSDTLMQGPVSSRLHLELAQLPMNMREKRERFYQLSHRDLTGLGTSQGDRPSGNLWMNHVARGTSSMF
jgi:hypothetical protein